MNLNFHTKIKKILITGGGGFIGGSLIRYLLSNTKLEIYNLDKIGYCSDFTSINQILSKNKLLRDRYFFLNVDLCDELKTKEAINFSNPDLIFHLAAESHVDRSINNPKDFILNNINGTFNLLEAVRLHWENLSDYRKSFFKFHHISTDEVFGSLKLKLDFFSEKTPYSPRSPYSASKASSDHLVNAWHHTYGIPVVITNCSNNFGPWQFPEKLIPLVILKAINLERIPIYGNGENIRDWLFIEDHINALLCVAANAKPGSNYCIGGSQELTNNEIVLKICRVLDILRPSKEPYKNLINYVQDRPGHDLRYAISAKKIMKELGWKPNFNFNESLEMTIKWYLNNLDWCRSIKEKSGYYGQRLGKNGK